MLYTEFEVNYDNTMRPEIYPIDLIRNIFSKNIDDQIYEIMLGEYNKQKGIFNLIQNNNTLDSALKFLKNFYNIIYGGCIIVFPYSGDFAELSYSVYIKRASGHIDRKNWLERVGLQITDEIYEFIESCQKCLIVFHDASNVYEMSSI